MMLAYYQEGFHADGRSAVLSGCLLFGSDVEPWLDAHPGVSLRAYDFEKDVGDLCFFDPCLFSDVGSAYLAGKLIVASEVFGYLSSNPGSRVCAFDPEKAMSEWFFYDAASYDCWRDAYYLLDFVIWAEVPRWRGKHSKGDLSAFRYEPVDKISILR